MDTLRDTMHNSPSLLHIKWKTSNSSCPCSIFVLFVRRESTDQLVHLLFIPGSFVLSLTSLAVGWSQETRNRKTQLGKSKKRNEEKLRHSIFLFPLHPICFQVGWTELLPSLQTHLRSLEPREHHFSSFSKLDLVLGSASNSEPTQLDY